MPLPQLVEGTWREGIGAVPTKHDDAPATRVVSQCDGGPSAGKSRGYPHRMLFAAIARAAVARHQVAVVARLAVDDVDHAIAALLGRQAVRGAAVAPNVVAVVALLGDRKIRPYRIDKVVTALRVETYKPVGNGIAALSNPARVPLGLALTRCTRIARDTQPRLRRVLWTDADGPFGTHRAVVADDSVGSKTAGHRDHYDQRACQAAHVTMIAPRTAGCRLPTFHAGSVC